MFKYEAAKAPQHEVLARNAVKQFKTLRIPQVLSFVDSVELPPESSPTLYVVAEEAMPLAAALGTPRVLRDGGVHWGLYQVAQAVSFLNNEPKLAHGNLSPVSIFVTKSGDWKLAGFEMCCVVSDSTAVLRTHGDHSPLASKYRCPELLGGKWSLIAQAPPQIVDSWSLGMYAGGGVTVVTWARLRDVRSV